VGEEACWQGGEGVGGKGKVVCQRTGGYGQVGTNCKIRATKCGKSSVAMVVYVGR